MFGGGLITGSKLLNSIWGGVCEDWRRCRRVDKCIRKYNGGEGGRDHRKTKLTEA